MTDSYGQYGQLGAAAHTRGRENGRLNCPERPDCPPRKTLELFG